MRRKKLLLFLMLALGLPLAVIGQKQLPYEYGFENFDYFAEGWTAQSSTFMTGISADGHSGEYGFMFYKSPDPQYLISPELITTNNGLVVEFYYQNSASSYPKSFRVGYSTNGNGVSDFTFGDEITTTNGQWTFYSQTFDANTKYIAIKYEYNASSTSLFLDDFNFEEYAAYPKPKNLVVTTYTSSTATLDWGARTGQDHWDLYYTTSSTVPDVNTTPSIVNTATKPYTITGLASGDTYHAYVRGNYNNGEHYSEWSNVCSFEVGCYTPTIAESMATCNQAYFSWMPVGPESSWQVAFSDQQGFDPDAVTPETVTIQYYVKENLATGVTYYARVRAVCGAGDYSDWSEEVSMTTECFAPSTLRATSVSPNSATLGWQQGSNESQWQISYSATANFAPENGTIITVNTNSYTLEGLTVNTPYYAYVRAVCTETIFSDWSTICTFTPTYELTVSDDETNYNMYVPFYGSFVSYATKSQFIIPASTLTDLLYANINKLTFYAGVGTANFGNATFDVLISELDGVTVFENSEFFDWSTMTSVYSGSISVSNNKMEITLNNPYQYMGGDLLIGFNQTNSGNDVTAYWYGAATTGYSAYGGMEASAYSYSDYSRYKFIPKTSFSYTPGTAPTCLKPKNLASSNVDATSATLSWTNGGSETVWVLQYATDANFTQNVVSVNVSTNPHTLTGLTPETTYYAHVKASCGGDDYSTWSNVCSFTPSAIQTVVVNNGTGTSYYAPFYGSNTNSANVKSQFIITSTELADVMNQHITKLTFHTDTYYSSASFDGVFKVYLAPTALTEFTSTTPVDWTTLTEVYSGSLSISNNQMEVELSAPYLYTGGNLLVAFDETTMSSTGTFIVWLGVATENYPALSYNSTYYYRRQFLPKMTVTYNTAIAVCSAPTNLIVDATFNSATLTWTAGNEETDWNVQYKAASASEWSGMIAVEDNPTCTIDGLSASTEYDVRIQANCGSTLSPWLTGDFSTSCEMASIPYYYNFDSDAAGTTAAFPQCWTRYNDATNATYQCYPQVYNNTNNAHSAPNTLWFRALADNNYPDTQIAILPEMNADVNTLMLNFWASSSTGGTLKIGVMTDPDDITTYTEVGTVSIANNGATHSTRYSFNLSQYQGNGRNIAIRMDKTTTNTVIFVDDIYLTTIVPETIPYTHNFDTDVTGVYAGAPDGWIFIGNKYPRVYEGNAYSGSNDLMIYHDGNNPNIRQMAVLPEMDYTIQELQIVFWAKTWSKMTSSYLRVGVMTDPNDPTTFTQVESFYVGKDYNEHTVTFENYTGQGKYIAISDWAYNDDNTYFLIDDIIVEPIPSCRKPGQPYVNSYEIQAHQVRMTWQKGTEDQALWQLAIGTEANFNPDLVTPHDVDVNNPDLFDGEGTWCAYYLTGLDAATTYYVYVRANCGTVDEPDYSDWSALYCEFTTLGCDIPTGLSMASYTSTSASLWWNSDNGLASEYELAYSTDEFFNPEYPDDDTHVITGITELGYTIEDLTAETVYYACVRANCGDDGYSDWSETISFMPSAYHTMTLYEKWEISERAPLSMSYVHYNPDNDQQGIKGQYVLPENQLSELRFSNILGISLFTANTSLDFYTDAIFDVYMAAVDEPTMNGFISFDAMTQVYSGTLSIIDGVMIISFTTPFYYSEGSLMIGFKQLTVGEEHNTSVSWKGIYTHVVSCYTYDYWFETEEHGFSPTTQFRYEPCNAPSCPRPTMLKALPMSSFAKLSWSHGNGNCDVQYKKTTDAEWTLVEGVSISTYQPYILRNLEPSTDYVYQVRNVCSETEHSDWSKSCYFTTRSNQVITIDVDNLYTEGFDEAVFPPTDWVTESANYVSYWQQRETTQEHYHVAYSGYYNDAMMYSPEMHIDAQGAVLTLNHMHNSSLNGTATYCDIMISTDHGEHFSQLWGGRDATLVGDWITTQISLDEYVNQDIVLEFYHLTYNANHAWDINEIKIKAYNKVFNGSDNDNSWDNPDLWALDNGELPTADDEVLINSEVTIENGTVATAEQIYLNSAENNEEIQGSIVIEDGGQLVTNNTVEATVNMNTQQSQNKSSNAWYAISSPVNNVRISDFVAGTHNIYRYDEPTSMWQEYRNTDNLFYNLSNGRGYLYRSTVANIKFTGDVNVDDAEYTLKYTENAGKLKGFNLIGNPYPHNIYKGASNAAIPNGNLLEDKYCVLGVNGNWILTDDGTAIKPGTAILVQAKEAGNLTMHDVTTGGTAKRTENDKIWFTVSDNDYEDVACVEFREGRGFNKMAHYNEDAPMLYINYNGEDFASIDMNENIHIIDLCFKAKTMGQYTLKLNANGNISYLHLIDRLTGNDVDMLVEDEYSFIGMAGDNANRFIVKLDANSDGADDNFVYQNGDDIVVSGEGELQVFDVMGRMVASQRVNGVETLRKPDLTGVYIYKMNEKTQKIVVR